MRIRAPLPPPSPVPKYGDYRYRYKFLWWPTRIADNLYWLERVVVWEKYVENYYDGDGWRFVCYEDMRSFMGPDSLRQGS